MPANKTAEDNTYLEQTNKNKHYKNVITTTPFENSLSLRSQCIIRKTGDNKERN